MPQRLGDLDTVHPRHSPAPIPGTALSHTTSVTFDGTPALSYRIASDTEIDALVPAGTLGSADVSVTTLGGTTTASDAGSPAGRGHTCCSARR
ncbi:hypothetical protein [Streptomyces sp900116325]|uniref:hypothetical protein n=1 Tax=Streptomyces sp. 900116325 TaxID=3154295 RepID=UPI0033CFB48A